MLALWERVRSQIMAQAVGEAPAGLAYRPHCFLLTLRSCGLIELCDLPRRGILKTVLRIGRVFQAALSKMPRVRCPAELLGISVGSGSSGEPDRNLPEILIQHQPPCEASLRSSSGTDHGNASQPRRKTANLSERRQSSERPEKRASAMHWDLLDTCHAWAIRESRR